MIQIKAIISQWRKRYLTPIGKITVLKSLVLSLLNHILMSIPNPNNTFCKELEKLFYSFVWNSPSHRIKKDVITKPYEKGGLRMINISAYIASLKIFWIRQLIFTDKGLDLFIPNLDMIKLTTCGTDYVLEAKKTLKNAFWIDVFNAWLDLGQKDGLTDKAKGNTPLFFNPNIRIGRKTYFNKNMFKHNIHFVNDILHEDGTFYTYENFSTIYPHVKINFLEFY